MPLIVGYFARLMKDLEYYQGEVKRVKFELQRLSGSEAAAASAETDAAAAETDSGSNSDSVNGPAQAAI